MTVPSLTNLPAAPQRTDAPATFVTKADAFLGAVVTFQGEMNNSVTAFNTDFIAVGVIADNAATSASNAATSAAEAASSATAAASTAGAALWVSGQSYSTGDAAISLITNKTFRANTNTSGTTDPSVSADWTQISGEVNPDIISQSEAEGGTDTNGRLISGLRLKQSIGALSTFATLTKTFTAGELFNINLSVGVVTPVISVTKEIPQIGLTNNDWDAGASTYTLENSAYQTTLAFTGGGTPFILGTGSFSSDDVGKTIYVNDGVFLLKDTSGDYEETTAPSSYAQAASGDWSMYSTVYNSVSDLLELSSVLVGKYDPSTAVFDTSYGLSTYYTTTNQDIYFRPDGTRFYTQGGNDKSAVEWRLTTPFDVTSVNFSQRSIQSGLSSTKTITFSYDGLKMYISGGSQVHQFSVATAWDIASVTLLGNFNTSAKETDVSGMRLKPDGTKMFIVGGSANKVFEYALSTANDVSTATFTAEFDLSSQNTYSTDIAFSTDGTKMLIGGQGSAIREYSLSTGFDITTASYTGNSFTTPTTGLNGVDYNDDGTKMYYSANISGADSVYQYDLGELATPTGYHPAMSASIDTTYWADMNTTTATDTNTVYYAFSNDDRNTWSVLDNTDGTRNIVRNNAGTWQYNSDSTYTSTTWTNATINNELDALKEAMATSANQMDKTKLNAITDPNQIALGTDLDFTAILYSDGGSTVPTYSGTELNYDANVLNQGAILGTDYNYDHPASNVVRFTSVDANNLKIRIV